MHRSIFLLGWILLFSIAILGKIPLESEENLSKDTLFKDNFSEAPVALSIYSEEQSIKAGSRFWLALHFKLEDGWHIYWKNPGMSGMPVAIKWKLPSGIKEEKTLWPTPQTFEVDGIKGYGYENSATILTEFTLESEEAKNVEIEAEVQWLSCSADQCLPGSETRTIKLDLNEFQSSSGKINQNLFMDARKSIPEKKAVTANRNQGLIELKISHEKGIQEKGLDFYPENKITDPDTPPVYNKNDQTLLIKELDSTKETGEIKGVLTFTNDNGEKEAIEFEAPLSISGSSLLSMADASKVLDWATPSFQGGIGVALIFAFIGGMLLNLMPCVLPVLSFKVLGFVSMAGECRNKTLKHSGMFALGVLVSFWVLAGVMLILQAYGKAVGWGFQLQEPLFVAVLAAILLIFSLSLFGIFEIGTIFAAWAGQTQIDKKITSGYSGSFFSGVLATAVATPCTGPFLGSAVGFAMTLAAPLSLLIFSFLGLGMAFPYLMLAFFPNLLRFVPKPGPWMVTFKELMGFLMLASVLWLIWVFGAQTNNFSIFLLLLGFLSFAIGCWTYGKWSTPIKKKSTRIMGYVAAMLLFAVGSYSIFISTTPEIVNLGNSNSSVVAYQDDWEPFSLERVKELQSQGIPVFVDFTAKWCLICQANHLVLETDAVKSVMASKNVVRMKADWTKNDPQITQALKKFGRNSVPLYVLYGSDPSKRPEILPQVLTPQIVYEAVSHLNLKSELADNN